MDRRDKVAWTDRSLRPPGQLRCSLVLMCALGAVVCSGCVPALTRWASDGWLADYDTAEQRQRESGRELLILYKDTRPGADTSMEKALASPPVKEVIRDYVRCGLFKSYEPHRRYVAQYGIDRAPAVILVHRDGTYHARSGHMSTAKLAAFLARAKPPGARPVINPYIPRRPRYDWHGSIEKARQVARLTGRPLLIVFYRTLSRDWQELNKLLSRQEVYRRFADMVPCRIGLTSLSADAYITQFGALKLPAIVIADRDGGRRVLELPRSYEAVVRFADSARRRKHTPPSASTAAAEP